MNLQELINVDHQRLMLYKAASTH